MVSATQDIASTVSFQTARSTSPRDDRRPDSDSFGSLIDSNTAPNGTPDRAASQPDLPAPRSDEGRAASNDRSRQSDDRADMASSANARDRDTQTANAASDARKARQNDRSNAKSDPKSDPKTDSKADAKSKTDTDTKDASSKDTDTTAKTEGDAAISADKPVAVAAVAIAIPVPAVTTDVAVTPATPETTGATQPLAIAAAAVLKAQTAATAADATAPQADTAPAVTTPEAEANFAALIASAMPATGKIDTKKTGSTEATTATTADVKSDGKATAATATSAAPVATPEVTQTVAKDGKPEDTSADGAKPGAVAAEPAKPGVAASHERRSEHVAPTDAPDLTTPTSNTVQQQPLQTAQTTVAAAAPQLTATIATNAPVQLNGVAVEIAQNAKAGKSSFDIRLDPAELGRIDVRLEVDKHGNVTSHLTVEKPETLTMLRQDAPQLQRALEQAGLKTNDSGMQFSLRDQSSGQQQNSGENSGRNAQRLVIHEDDSMPAAVAGRGYGRMLGSSSGVDISI